MILTAQQRERTAQASKVEADASDSRAAHDAWVAQMETIAGRAFVWRLLQATGGVNGTAFSSNATEMAHRATLADFRLRAILEPIEKHCPHQRAVMFQENQK